MPIEAPMDKPAKTPTLPSVEIDMKTEKASEPVDFFSDYRLGSKPPVPGDDPAKAAPEATAIPGTPPSFCPATGEDGFKKIVKDSKGQITSFTDQSDVAHQISFDDKGRMTKSMETNADGKLLHVSTVNYDDVSGVKTTASVDFNSWGGLGRAVETQEQYKDGKLREIRDTDGDTEIQTLFDEKGREVGHAERNPYTDEMRSSINREFRPDGSVAVKSVDFQKGIKASQTEAVFDKDDNVVGAQVSRSFDEQGNETMRRETTIGENGAKSSKLFEKGELLKEVSSVETKKAHDKKGVTEIVEKQMGPDGKLREQIEATFFPRQPYLPTQVKVKGPDGTTAKTVDIEYVTGANGQLRPQGPVALVKSLTVTTPEGSTTSEFKGTRDQIRAWKDVFKATDNIDSFSVPIGRSPKAQSIGPVIDSPRGRTADDIINFNPGSGPA